MTDSDRIPKDLQAELRSIRRAIEALEKRLEQRRDEGDCLSEEEAARRLGISARTLRRHAQGGLIRPLRIGGRKLYTPQSIEALKRDAARRVGR